MLESLRIEKHPDKTIMGKIAKGFGFLGYHLSPEELGVAKKTIEEFLFLLRAVQLYEQEQKEPYGPPLLGLYVRRWFIAQARDSPELNSLNSEVPWGYRPRGAP